MAMAVPHFMSSEYAKVGMAVITTQYYGGTTFKLLATALLHTTIFNFTYTMSIVCVCTAPVFSRLGVLVGLHRNVPVGFPFSTAIALFL